MKDLIFTQAHGPMAKEYSPFIIDIDCLVVEGHRSSEGILDESGTVFSIYKETCGISSLSRAPEEAKEVWHPPVINFKLLSSEDWKK